LNQNNTTAQKFLINFNGKFKNLNHTTAPYFPEPFNKSKIQDICNGKLIFKSKPYNNYTV